MFSGTGHFSVALANDDENVEDVHSIYEDYEEAMQAALDLTDQHARGVYIYEAAVFKIGKTNKTEMILFWWNKHYALLLDEVPRGRGHGYYWPSRGAARFVDYTPDPDFSHELDSETPDHEADTEEEYVKSHCQFCGKITPLYELQEYVTEEKVGRSSSLSRAGRSSSQRTSSRGTSYIHGSSGSVSSGRTYYRTLKKFLCEECYKQQSSADWTWFFFKWGFYAVIAAVVLIIFARS